MTLAAGTRLGPYEITGSLGAGGMGEVYKARDTRLDRTVAIKILSAEFAADPERRGRFEREARAVAALNHPHICDLHDVGESPSPESPSSEAIRFLVMEYLEGQTLADRLVRGPLPPAEVLRCAIEIADALDHAHRRGLVHRDLKPANVMLTKAGAKLLDFGLSKLQPPLDLVSLSTMTISPAAAPLTVEGMVLGTFPYMSPEQLAGGEAGARSDIFAFGAVLYEMATGRRAFEGTTAATVIGAILHGDPPPPSTLQPLTPLALDRIISRCLAKDPDDRWQTARDLMLELKWAAEHRAPAVADRTRDKKLGVVASASVAVAVLAIGALAVLYVRRTPRDDSTVRLAFSPPEGVTLADAQFGAPVTISPDGQRLVFPVVAADGTRSLWVRPLDSVAAKALPGTDGASDPFWSPDSQSVAFFTGDKLKKVEASGGPVLTLCDAALTRGGTWNRAGVIVFSANAGRQLYRIPAAGGDATPLTLDQSTLESLWPDFLPDNRHVVYHGRRPKPGAKPGIYLASLDSSVTTFIKDGYIGVEYAEPGYLLLLKGGTRSETAGMLMAQRFDPNRLELVGEALPVAELVAIRPLYARGVFSASENGRLVFGTNDHRPTRLVWLDREGTERGSVAKPAAYMRAALSPDELTVAVEVISPDEQAPDIWLMDMTRSVMSNRLTRTPIAERMPLWSPDGKRIVFSAGGQGNAPNLFEKASNGTGAAELLFRSDLVTQPTDWSRDGTSIVYGSLDPKTGFDLWTVSATPNPAGGDRKPVPYLQTPADEHHGHLSPDGKWMAYASDDSGKWEVYVCAFPQCGRRTPISTDGGTEPRWRRDGKELFYVTPDRRLMAVAVQPDADFKAGAPRALFTARFLSSSASQWRPDYTNAGDGQRFLINTFVGDAAPSPVTVILNWPAAFRGR